MKLHKVLKAITFNWMAHVYAFFIQSITLMIFPISPEQLKYSFMFLFISVIALNLEIQRVDRYVKKNKTIKGYKDFLGLPFKTEWMTLVCVYLLYGIFVIGSPDSKLRINLVFMLTPLNALLCTLSGYYLVKNKFPWKS